MAVRVQCRVDDRPKRRRPGRAHRIAPPPTTVMPLATDWLAAAAWTPLLVVGKRIPPDAHAVRDRAPESSTLVRCVDVDVPGATPATSSRCGVDERQLLRAVSEPGATTPGHQRSVHAGQQAAAGPPWVACDPSPARLLPSCDRDRRSKSQIGHFSCGAVRTPAQAFCLHRVLCRSPSPSSYRVEAAGIEPASAVAPSRASTSVVRA